MELSKRTLLLLVIVGGIAMGVSFPFTGGLFPLAFLAFVPIILVNVQLNKQKRGRFFLRFGLNYLYFLLYNGITVWWIYNASEGGMYMAVFCNALLMTLPFFFFGFIARNLGENKGLLSLLAFWISFEYAHYFWELSWPWLSFGNIFGNYPSLIQWYEFSGVTGGTCWILLVNIAVYLVVRNVFIKKETWRIQTPIFWLGGLALFIPIVSSLLIYWTYEEEVDPIEIVVVQPNFDAWEEKFYIPLPDQLDVILRLADENVTEETDLILCPETAISRPVYEQNLDQEYAIIRIKEFLRAHYNVPMLTGADSYDMFPEENSIASVFSQGANAWVEDYNAAFLIDPNRPVQVYHKSKPVLGAEKVPFLSWFPSLKEYSVEFGGTSGMIGLGEEPLNFSANDYLFAPIICYESVYGDYVSYYTARGADLLCVITNDGWWGDTPGYKQHQSFSQIRAIENRRGLARSANTGISCLINQRGEVTQSLGWDEEGAIKGTLNRNKEITFFVRYGDVIGRISMFLALAMFIYAITMFAKSSGWAERMHLTRKP